MSTPHFPERLAAVTVESLTTAANRLLVPESLVYVVVADAANVHDSLRALDWAEVTLLTD